jgi:protein-S-isoprenylcysteine O-methyltransferase Ste14
MNTKPSVLKAIFPSIILILIQAILLFGTAGTWVWWNGWVYLLYNLISGLSVSLIIYRDSPELAVERRTAAKKAKTWDKVVVFLQVLVLPLTTLVLAGLDKRWGWTHSITLGMSLWALLVMVASSVLIFWSMKSNPFFSSFVRVQEDRKQVAVSGGPYAFIRHPAYLGMMLGGLAIPIQLGSAIAVWVGLANFILVLLRTFLEDRTLMEGLIGYKEYSQKVRYRLVPCLF